MFWNSNSFALVCRSIEALLGLEGSEEGFWGKGGGQRFDFLALPVDEEETGEAAQLVQFHEGGAFVCLVLDAGENVVALDFGADGWVGQHFGVEAPAGGAPDGGKIGQHRFAGCFGLGERLLERVNLQTSGVQRLASEVGLVFDVDEVGGKGQDGQGDEGAQEGFGFFVHEGTGEKRLVAGLGCGQSTPAGPSSHSLQQEP